MIKKYLNLQVSFIRVDKSGTSVTLRPGLVNNDWASMEMRV